MAEEKTDTAEERRPAVRLVLKRMVAMTIPVDASEEQVQAALDALYPKAKKAERAAAVGEAWQEVARVESASKNAAIEAHAGKPGTPDAKQGTFRAVTMTAWKDGMTYSAPPKPLVERTVVE